MNSIPLWLACSLCLLSTACANTALDGATSASRLPANAQPAAAPPPAPTLQGLRIADPAQLAAAIARYDALTPPKAQAVAIAADGELASGESRGRTHELGAVGAALVACDVARVQTRIDAPCELHRLNDETFELGRALRIRTRADDPSTPTALWRFDHGNAVLYVAGSMHAQRATALPMAPALETAYGQAQTLFVEVDMARVTQAELLDAARRYSLLPPGQTLDGLLSPAQREPLQKAASQLGVPWSQLDQMRPGSALSVLSVAALATAGFDPANGVESLLLRRAREDGKVIVGIERYADQVALLADAPTDDGTQATAAALAPEGMRAGVLALFDAWMRADDEAILHAFTGGAADATESVRSWTARLLDARNEHMAASAIAHLDTGSGTALLVVGAGHLPGPRGVIALLARAGFTGMQLARGGLPVSGSAAAPP